MCFFLQFGGGKRWPTPTKPQDHLFPALLNTHFLHLIATLAMSSESPDKSSSVIAWFQKAKAGMGWLKTHPEKVAIHRYTSIYWRFPSHSWFKTLLSKVKPGKVLYLVQVEAMTEVSRVPVEAKAWANSFNIKWNSSLCLKNAPNPCTMFGDSGVWDLIWNIPMQILKLMRQRPQLCPCQFHLVVHRDHMVSVALLLHSSSLHVPLLQRIFCFLCCASSSCFGFRCWLLCCFLAVWVAVAGQLWPTGFPKHHISRQLIAAAGLVLSVSSGTLVAVFESTSAVFASAIACAGAVAGSGSLSLRFPLDVFAWSATLFALTNCKNSHPNWWGSRVFRISCNHPANLSSILPLHFHRFCDLGLSKAGGSKRWWSHGPEGPEQMFLGFFDTVELVTKTLPGAGLVNSIGCVSRLSTPYAVFQVDMFKKVQTSLGVVQRCALFGTLNVLLFFMTVENAPSWATSEPYISPPKPWSPGRSGGLLTFWVLQCTTYFL